MARKKDRDFFKKNLRESLNYIRDSRIYIYSIIGVFILFSLFGFFIPVPDSLREVIINFIEELLLQTQGLSFLEITWFLFSNNIQSSFFGMIYGVVLGIFPVLASMANGYLVGFVAHEVSAQEGILILWRLLPHGIFELPALFISLGLGVKLGSFVFKKNRIETLRTYFLNSLKAFFFVVFPLLVIAAFIEGGLISFFG